MEQLQRLQQGTTGCHDMNTLVVVRLLLCSMLAHVLGGIHFPIDVKGMPTSKLIEQQNIKLNECAMRQALPVVYLLVAFSIVKRSEEATLPCVNS